MQNQNEGKIYKYSVMTPTYFKINAFLLKRQEKDCMTIDAFQHVLPSLNCSFFPSVCILPFATLVVQWPQTKVQSPRRKCCLKFYSHKWNVSNFAENFTLTTNFHNKFCYLKQICQVKFHTFAQNFTNSFTTDAGEILPKKIVLLEILQTYIEFWIN